MQWIQMIGNTLDVDMKAISLSFSESLPLADQNFRFEIHEIDKDREVDRSNPVNRIHRKCFRFWNSGALRTSKLSNFSSWFETLEIQ